jgi:hypothetical protein
VSPLADDQKIHLPKMDPALKRKWVKALRSGKYRRVQAHLKDERGYCCLGVLCHITGHEFEPTDTFLPVDLAPIAHLGRDTQEVLANLNDGEYDDDEVKGFGRVWRYMYGKGAPFSAIADFIEEHL